MIFNLKDSYKYQARTFLGYRYQGGDGSNKGIVIEGSLFYRVMSTLSIGAGLYADVSSETETIDGEIIKFNNSISPVFLAEWSFSPEFALGLKFILAEYKTATKVYDGNQIAFYIQRRF